MFANYNDNDADGTVANVGRLWNAMPFNFDFPVYTRWEYGEQTYRYYEVFQEYNNILEKNKVK